MGEVENAGVIVLFRLLAEHVIELHNPAGIRIEVVKVEPQQTVDDGADLVRNLVRRDGGLDDLEHPGLVLELKRVVLFSCIDKAAQFADTPFGLHVTRCHDADHHPRLLKFTGDGSVEHVIPSQLRIAPNPWLLSQQLSQADLKNPVKLGDPALLPLGQRPVIQVRVTDENIIHGHNGNSERGD